ncbi:unnamed protein product [Orchesella dallaii]|uniref:Uncharacterized protein n=1 Tax=Orchesella dallaii TaxID=48710 RepID=A0ABP1S8I3_9HEXA
MSTESASLESPVPSPAEFYSSTSAHTAEPNEEERYDYIFGDVSLSSSSPPPLSDIKVNEPDYYFVTRWVPENSSRLIGSFKFPIPVLIGMVVSTIILLYIIAAFLNQKYTRRYLNENLRQLRTPPPMVISAISSRCNSTMIPTRCQISLSQQPQPPNPFLHTPVSKTASRSKSSDLPPSYEECMLQVTVSHLNHRGGDPVI